MHSSFYKREKFYFDQLSPTGKRFLYPKYCIDLRLQGYGFKLFNENGEMIIDDNTSIPSNEDAIFSQDGEYIFLNKCSGGLVLYNKDGIKLWENEINISTSGTHYGSLPYPTLDVAKNYCAIIGGNKKDRSISNLYVYNILGKLLWEKTYEGNFKSHLRFSLDGAFLFTYSREKMQGRANYKKPIIRLYNSENGDLMWNNILDIPENSGIASIYLTNNAKYIVVSARKYDRQSDNGTLYTYLFNKDGELIKEFADDCNYTQGAKFSQDGKYLIINYGIK